MTGQISRFRPANAGTIGSNQGICHGETPAEFTSTTSASGGNPLGASYQWQISTDSVNFSDILNATSPNFQSEALTATRHFRRNHLNACGNVSSNVITVTVHSLPSTPTVQSVVPNTDCSGDNPNGIIVIAEVAGMTYSIDGITFGTNRTFSGLTHGLHTIFIRNANNCVSSDTVSVPSASGAPYLVGTMTVTPSDTICNPVAFAGPVVITPTFNNLGDSVPTFQWSSSVDGGTTFTTITGATTQALTLAFAPDVTTIYRIRATNTETSCHVYYYHTVLVVSQIAITTQPVGGSICVGQTAITLTVAASSSGHTYQWQRSSDSITFTDISSATSSAHIVPSTSASAYWYRVQLLSTSGACPPVLSNAVRVNVVVVPTVVFVTLDTICGAGTATLSATANPATANIRWFSVQTDGAPLITGTPNTGVTASGDTWTTPNITTTTTFWAEAHNGVCASAARTSVVATVAQPHTLVLTSAAATADQTVGANSAITQITYTRGGSATAVTVTWTGTANANTAPAGITVSSLTGNPITITGNPTTVGTFGFSIATVAGACPASDTLTGTITVTIPMTGCNNLQPGWGAGALGAGFATSHTWTIQGTGARPSQEWSDAVTATACAPRTTFNGGTVGNFNADCRNSYGNANFSGHYFSWCAVMRFADTLCPYPWRVPTVQDFVDLDLNLGGPGNSVTITNVIGLRGYTGNLNSANGGRWGGSRFTSGVGGTGGFIGHDVNSIYWSSTERDAESVFILHLQANWSSPNSWNPKSNGFALRCVRDIECDGVALATTGPTANQIVITGQTIAPVTVNLVSGPSGTATAVNIRWRIINADLTETPTTAPAGLIFNAATRTLSGSTTQVGNFAFDIFTTNHTAPCPEAVFTGTLRVTLPMAGCNWNTPNFGGAATGVTAGQLGTVTWGNTTNNDIATGSTVVSRAGAPPAGAPGTGSLAWSGPVFAQGCAKGNATANTNFSGGSTGNFNADCRQSLHTFNNGRAAGITGDFFSWCAVMRFADTLCPAPWRVPTAADFAHLHWILTGVAPPAAVNSNAGTHIAVYAGTSGTAAAPEIGGTWRGVRFTGWASTPAGPVSSYWSSTELSTTNAGYLRFGSTEVVPRASNVKNVGLTVRCVRDSVVPPPPMTGCNNLTPGWGSGALGAGFASTTTWVVTGTGGRTSQEWSDAVTATACAPRGAPAFNGGTTGNFNADCSNSALNPNFGGHYFSWCAVMRFADQLCPYPWRVPTRQDFVDLDLNLGGTGANRGLVAENAPTGAVTLGYVGTVVGTTGGRWGGTRFTGRADIPILPESWYWSSTEQVISEVNAFMMGFTTGGLLPQGEFNKQAGLALRCVRDWTVETVGCNSLTPGFGGAGTPVAAGLLGNVTWGNTTNTNPQTGSTPVSRAGTPPADAPGPGVQTWSGPVFAQGCAKGNAISSNAFSGGTTSGNFNADCRQSLHTFNNGRAAGITGDLFSWCAVIRFGDQLCPAPWRVPTAADFAHLHWILTGASHGGSWEAVAPGLYIPPAGTAQSPQIGGVWGGVRFPGNAGPITNSLTVSQSNFWSSTESSPVNARFLGVDASTVHPQLAHTKGNGYAVRCVR